MVAAAENGQELVKQLLGATKRSEQKKVVAHLRHLLRELIVSVKTSFPRNIEIQKDISCDIIVIASVVRIKQAILNLCINANHGIGPSAGVLKLSLRKITVTEGEELT